MEKQMVAIMIVMEGMVMVMVMAMLMVMVVLRMMMRMVRMLVLALCLIKVAFNCNFEESSLSIVQMMANIDNDRL